MVLVYEILFSLPFHYMFGTRWKHLYLIPDFIQLASCPEASVHLQELKDMLIGISNDLLDNVSNLNADQIEKLRQDRLLVSPLSCFISL